MDIPEGQPGQHIDELKKKIILPDVCNMITKSFKPGESINLLDIGTGDGSSVTALVEMLNANGINISALTLADCDTGIFPQTVTRLSESMDRDHNMIGLLVETDEQEHFGPSLESYENRFDVITAQMAVHQINNPELSLLLCHANLALKDTGKLIITDLNTDYLQYLLENESTKYQQEIGPDGRVEGTYVLGETPVHIYPRKVEELLALLISCGFIIKKSPVYPSMEPARAIKTRYADLADRGISMFNVIEVEKSRNPTAYTEGTVQSIEQTENGIQILFADNESLALPPTAKIEQVQQGDKLITFRVALPGNDPAVARIFQTAWVVPVEGDRPLQSTSWIAKSI